MSGVDVRDLAREGLAPAHFPASAKSDFRLYMAPGVHQGTWEHAKRNVAVEICGVLVGNWHSDENGPYAVVTNFIPCENASSKFAEVTFTHESWSLINREMDTRFANERIIGWYHSHPDFGIFLSDRDCFIHEHFFSGPGQVAYVIDPVRELEGVFAWRGGKPTPLEHYWVGNTIRTIAASRLPTSEVSGHAQRAALADDAPIPSVAPRQSTLDLAATLLSWLALFLLGYLVASMPTRWERETMIEGTVAHYGFNKLMKIGLEENLAKVQGELRLISAALDGLPQAGDDLSDDERESVAKQRTLISDNLQACEQAIGKIQQFYGLSDEERIALLRLIARKQAELQAIAERSAAARNPETAAAAPNPNSPVGKVKETVADTAAQQSAADENTNSKPQ